MRETEYQSPERTPVMVKDYASCGIYLVNNGKKETRGRKKHTKPMWIDPYFIDDAIAKSAYERIKAGENAKQVANDYGLSQSSLSKAVDMYEVKAELDVIKDVGKAHALREAGWTIAKIADEFRSSMKAVEDALAKPKPVMKERKHKYDDRWYW